MRKSVVSAGLWSKCVTREERSSVGKLRASNVDRTRAVAACGEVETSSCVSARVAAYASLFSC